MNFCAYEMWIKDFEKVDSQLCYCGMWKSPDFSLLVGDANVTSGLLDILISSIAPSACFCDGTAL